MKQQLAVLVAVLFVQVALAEECPKCENKVIELREVVICEGDQKILRCPEGTKMVVHEAYYGRRNTNLCRRQTATSAWDVSEICSSPKADWHVKNRCNGKKECELTAVNSRFTDPCLKRNKYLEVLYSCRT
ncbi:D-galactoside-specific lectin-like [Halyomorpha halys]|uniref:D-galactoside-specific lectin-like n=1 Tax=Halyomorpha halys TaxID=286706 RepID=UPI0006D52383|nr:D-galactoside-specific lectin-like [Halyomorpha halys]